MLKNVNLLFSSTRFAPYHSFAFFSFRLRDFLSCGRRRFVSERSFWPRRPICREHSQPAIGLSAVFDMVRVFLSFSLSRFKREQRMSNEV